MCLCLLSSVYMHLDVFVSVHRDYEQARGSGALFVCLFVCLRFVCACGGGGIGGLLCLLGGVCVCVDGGCLQVS